MAIAYELGHQLIGWLLNNLAYLAHMGGDFQ